MPLHAASPVYLHILQNLSLVLLSLSFYPLCTLIAICSHIVSPHTKVRRDVQKFHSTRTTSLGGRPRVILVTGMGMSKGLSIARAFYREGHIVIGADFEPSGVPVCGRFSRAIKKFYRLSRPASGREGLDVYIAELLKIISHEKVDLWVSCSGVATAIEDAEAAEAVEKRSKCKAVQFGSEITKVLHEKHSFMEKTKSLGLTVPETHVITSLEDAMAHLDPDKTSAKNRRFIMKSIGLDDSIRADIIPLPFKSAQATTSYISRLRPSSSRPFILQRYVKGPEYCTHSIVVHGKVKAFTACPSSELLMHYKALPSASELFKAMNEYTKIYAAKLGDVTGHFSIDFMLDEEDKELDLIERLYPIECNPRAHTAVVLFESGTQGMVNAYLSLVGDNGSNKTTTKGTVVTSSTVGHYWIGHDIVTRIILPIFAVLTFQETVSHVLFSFREFAEHIISWKDGTFEIWDPWPFWSLYCIYWPGIFLSAIVTQSWWSRCNVSTTKVFRC